MIEQAIGCKEDVWLEGDGLYVAIGSYIVADQSCYKTSHRLPLCSGKVCLDGIIGSFSCFLSCAVSLLVLPSIRAIESC